MVSATTPSHALDVSTPVAAYRHDVFDTRVGAPRSALAMAQTVDGWLWFGTPTGLYRFDGVRFENFHPLPGEHLLGQYIRALLPHPNGDLWISYLYGGVSVLTGGRLHHLPHRNGLPVSQVTGFAADGDDVWMASSSGLLRYRDQRWQHFDASMGFAGDTAVSVYRDPYGRVWAADSAHVYLLDRAKERFYRMFPVTGDTVFATSPDGRVWAADGTTVRLMPTPANGWHQAEHMRVYRNTQQTLFDRDGNYWSGNCPSGICVLRPSNQQLSDGSFADLTSAGRSNDGRIGNPSVVVTSMLEDREGNLWTATTAGVERMRDTRLVPLVLPPASGWPSMALDTTETVWIASTNMAANGRLWKVEGEHPVEQQSGQASALVVQGRGGTVLVGGSRWIERRLGSKVIARYPMPVSAEITPARDMVLLLAEDSDGIWLYQGGRGLMRLRNGIWAPVPAEAGLARAIYAFVDADGRTWFGTRDNRVVVIDRGQRTEYGAADGIDLGAVTFVHPGSDRIISGDNGTAVWSGQRFRRLHAEDIDLVNVSGFAASEDGSRWLNTTRGLFHVKMKDWQRSMADPALPLRGSLLDELDGFPGIGHGISPVPTLRLGGDGRLWVSGTDGVAVLDRKRMAVNKVAPTAFTFALSADSRRYARDMPRTLPAGTERLRFDFTAPSMTMPERLRFNYRLVGFDQGWLDSGTMRSASYTNLGPGEYHFEVQAINEDGIAGPIATTTFQIEPSMYQTRWFAALCMLTLLLLLRLMYDWRLGQIKRALQLRMDERLTERERIARALHDTFLQGFQGLILHLDVVVARLSPASSERAQMEALLGAARKVIEDGRDQVMDLRCGTFAIDLDVTLAMCIEELRTLRDMQVMLEQIGTPRQLDTDVRQEVEAIAREAIGNAFRHAGANRLDVILDWTGHAFALHVIDDGAGMEQRVLLRGRPGHWGLQGMRERAKRIDASLSISNRRSGGVEIRLHLGGARPVRWWKKLLPASR